MKMGWIVRELKTVHQRFQLTWFGLIIHIFWKRNNFWIDAASNGITFIQPFWYNRNYSAESCIPLFCRDNFETTFISAYFERHKPPWLSDFSSWSKHLINVSFISLTEKLRMIRGVEFSVWIQTPNSVKLKHCLIFPSNL